MVKEKILTEIKSMANFELATHHSKFFKTGKGEYAENDLFYGIKVPDIRKIAKKYFKTINLIEIDELIKDRYHEVRLAALIMLILKYKQELPDEQKKIYELYLNNVYYINNWDLVDISAPNIVGAYLFDKKKGKLWDLANSKHLWSERIAVVSTLFFIKKGLLIPTIELSEYFIHHKHDLIHKATGWMLRETGKQDIDILYSFLDRFHKTMPRTMLRYAIEKFLPEKKQLYMKK